VATVSQTLEDLNLSHLPVMNVLNKADDLLLPDGRAPEREDDLAVLEVANPTDDGDAVLVSALMGWGIDALRDRIILEVLGERVLTAPVAPAVEAGSA